MILTNLNGWQRIGLILSVVWALFILGATAKEYVDVNDLEDDLSRGRGCPTLNSGKFIQWYDSRSGNKISIYKEGERSINCKEATDRANSRRKQYAQGLIEPVQRVEYLRLLAAIAFPILTFWIIAYLAVWLVKWVRKGFNPNNRRNV